MVSQRVSSSKPNAQNWPRKLRNMVVAKPGHVLVGADADQLELRYASALAGASNYLQAFADKKDPHAMSAAHCFGDRFTSIDKEKDAENWNRVRDVSKRFVYLAIYGGEAEAAHAALSSAEDKDGNFIYDDLRLNEVRAIHKNWLGMNPEYETWWEKTVALFRRQGFLRDSVLGMRRDFLDGENPNELYNFDCQSGGAGVVWLSTFDLMDQGLDKYLVAQVHDSLSFEVPEDEAEAVREQVTKAMTRRVPGLDVEFSGKAAIYENWRDPRKAAA
jgi:DNA polymerase-1